MHVCVSKNVSENKQMNTFTDQNSPRVATGNKLRTLAELICVQRITASLVWISLRNGHK